MERINVTQAARNFSDLLNRVYYQGISVELERNNKVIAQLVPVKPAARLRVEDLNAFFASLPKLRDDAETFAEDIESIRRELPPERSPWE
jgi:antitoxin (DNA-binding transcriptional repressor) of toxin-antitoxin stability system